jgi:transposase
VRAVALDVHRDFCEVAIVAEGRLRSAGRIEARPEALELFGQSLDATDWVALEVTGNAWEIARIIEPHVARVIVVSPSDTGIRQARAKTDRLDARALAKLLWAGELDGVSTPDQRVRAMRRRLARRSQLVRARSRAKNEIHAVLMRCLKDRPPASEPIRRQRPPLASRTATPGRRARDGRLRHAPGRVPRHRDRRGRAADRRRGAVLA